LVALTPASVIQQLGGLTAAAEGEPPLLSVHLASGQVLDGALREAVAQVRSDEMGREAWGQVHALQEDQHIVVTVQ